MRALEIMQTKKVWAVVGVTKNQDKYGYKIYQKLKQKGYRVYGVNPKYNEINTDKVYSTLEEIPEKPQVVVLVVNPSLGEEYVRACYRLGISIVWMQPGSRSEELVDIANSNDIEVVQTCVLVVANQL